MPSKAELLAQLEEKRAKLQAQLEEKRTKRPAAPSSRDVTNIPSPRTQKLEAAAPPLSARQQELADKKAALKRQQQAVKDKAKKAAADVATRGKDVADSRRVHEREAQGAAERDDQRKAESARVQEEVATQARLVQMREEADAQAAAEHERVKKQHALAREATDAAIKALAASKAARVEKVTVELEYARGPEVRRNRQYLDGTVLMMAGSPNAEGDLFSFVDYMDTTDGLPPNEARSRKSRQQAPGLQHSGDIWFDASGKRQTSAESAVRCKQRIDVDLKKVGESWSHLFFVLSSYTSDARISEFISAEVPCLLTIRNARTPDAEPLAVVASKEAQGAAQLAFIICSLERCPAGGGGDWQFFARYKPSDGHAPTDYDETFSTCFDLMAGDAEHGVAAYSKMGAVGHLASNVMRFGHKLKVRAQLKLQQKERAAAGSEGRGGGGRGGGSASGGGSGSGSGGGVGSGPGPATGAKGDDEVASSGGGGTASPPPLADLSRKYTYDCFLSHNWGKDSEGRDNHARVVQIANALKAAGLRPWLDEELMAGDINNTMSEAIENSACVVCFVTSAYAQKASGKGPNGPDDNCAYEFNTALTAEHVGVDRMIAVVMEPGCLNTKKWPMGTVKGKLATKLYVDLSSDDDAKLADGNQRLVKEVEKALKAGVE